MSSIPTKRIESIGSFGDLKAGWYFQSDTMPQVAEMQAQHDALVAALKAKGVEVHHVDGVAGGRLKSCYTRDPLIMVKGGAIVCRMGTRIRRGEELAITRTLARLGIPDPAHAVGQRPDGRRQLCLDQSSARPSSAAASG